jgi:hypothetical protein
MIQYKKIEARPSRGWIYLPDDRFQRQMSRMRALDDRCPHLDGAAQYRLYSKPCWIKLCQPQTFVTDSQSLIEGMYLPTTIVESLLLANTQTGTAMGGHLTSENVDRYLNPSTFTALVADGWIGSQDIGTEAVKEQVRLSLASRHSTTVGIDYRPRPLGNSRT